MDEERVVDGRIKTIVLPTPERAAKGDLDIEETGRGGVNIRVKRALNDVLQWYARNGHITDGQKYAGMKFHALWFHGAFKTGHAIMKYGDRVSGTPDADGCAKAQQAYHYARKAIRGTREKEVALRVCCYGESAGKRGQMDLLRNALDDLAAHFESERKKQSGLQAER